VRRSPKRSRRRSVRRSPRRRRSARSYRRTDPVGWARERAREKNRPAERWGRGY
jgi:hypothetical protein